MLGSLGWAGQETGWGSGGLGADGPGGQLLDAGWSASCLSSHRLLSFAASSSRLQGLAFSESRCGLAQGGDSRATSTPLTLIHLPREKGTHSLPQTSGHRHLTRNCLPGLPTAPLLRRKRQQPQPLLLKKGPHGHPYLSSSSTPQPLPHVAQTNQRLLAPPAAPPTYQDHCSPRGLLHGPCSSLFQPKRTVCAPASSTVTHGFS